MDAEAYYSQIKPMERGTLLGIATKYTLSTVSEPQEYHIMLFGEHRVEAGIITGVVPEKDAIATIYYKNINGVLIPYCEDRGTRTAGPNRVMVSTRMNEKGFDRVLGVQIGLEEVLEYLRAKKIEQFSYIPKLFLEIK